MYKAGGKRALDIACAVLALLVFCWLYGLVALAVAIKLGRPVIFSQERPGKGEKIFKLYKFRTMTDKRDAEGNLLPDSVRLTKFGQRLRRWSLDELPEVWNILRGDMSVVGPRPLVVEYLPYYSEEERKRHSVRPGLTGKAQVDGRNLLSWDEKLRCDLYYVENFSFRLDVVLVCKTIGRLFDRRYVLSGEVLTLEDGTVVRPLHIEREEKRSSAGVGHV